ncbi:MAG: RNA-binding protein [Hydrogenophaga sp.]|nr:RNA-binding protein [Hydrogenophaga sp.]
MTGDAKPQIAIAEGERLAKRVAAQLGCSRSEAERYVAGGWVRVDGQVVETPETRVSSDQTVTLDEGARPEDLSPVTLLWHKPAGVLLPECLHLPSDVALRWLSDEHRSANDRSRIRPLLAHRHRLQPLLPLAVGESGLMVFTQSVGVARKLGETAADLEHEWFLDLPSDVPVAETASRDATLRSLGQAVSFQGRQLPPARTSWQSDRRLRLAVKGCRPGQLAFLVERAGLVLASARRQRLGRVALTGLDSGQWRYLLPTERF